MKNEWKYEEMQKGKGERETERKIAAKVRRMDGNV